MLCDITATTVGIYTTTVLRYIEELEGRESGRERTDTHLTDREKLFGAPKHGADGKLNTAHLALPHDE
jgi:hypothetical protein